MESFLSSQFTSRGLLTSVHIWQRSTWKRRPAPALDTSGATPTSSRDSCNFFYFISYSFTLLFFYHRGERRTEGQAECTSRECTQQIGALLKEANLHTCTCICPYRCSSFFSCKCNTYVCVRTGSTRRNRKFWSSTRAHQAYALEYFVTNVRASRKLKKKKLAKWESAADT